ncbi:hypothetical protein CXG81DRAFT_11879 [Caulochytrium protostelioides]|uniref:60S ribosomal protein L6 n=1 Tax=Caulochytrium protostelioides TaxID=1555241 RepID=A0A4V1IUR9_9FUNG|nr:hypothetical protein CXG81DRAFT_11879 [Caulochytrium protostelioides]|eukprot:RKP01519.1 hypothetical protein CXG81DRAFT_11879 [Caulochytrium protostelioides]
MSTHKEVAFASGTRLVALNKGPKTFPAEAAQIKKAARSVNNAAKLRKSITPGTVLILVAGRFAGKRVVCLSQLASGTLLVSGPFAINGVPLRRVNPAYVIATSTKIDISGVQVPAHINDAYFKRAEQKIAKRSAEQLFDYKALAATKPELPAQRIEDQKIVDQALLAAIKKVDLMKEYLKDTFVLPKGVPVHAIKF